jgi:predicted FMN-binding regulatory protein PaiB
VHILRPMFDWDRDGALEFAASRGFGAMVASGASGPVSSHVPFEISRSSDAVTVQFHLIARNRLAELTPKQPWSLSTMEASKRETMLQSIVVLEMDVKQVEGQRKLNQHKSDEDYASITRHLSKSDAADAREIAAKLKALRPHLDY